MEAVERYGVVRGGMMAAGRVLRCHPLAKGGLDPVVKDAVGNPSHSQKVRISGAPTMPSYGDATELRWTDECVRPYVSCGDSRRNDELLIWQNLRIRNKNHR